MVYFGLCIDPICRSRSGTKTTSHVTWTRPTYPSPNPLTPITFTLSYRVSSNPTHAAYNAPLFKLSPATHSKGTTHFTTAPLPPITRLAHTAVAFTTSGTSSTNAASSRFPGPVSSLVATYHFTQSSPINTGDAAFASSSKPPKPSSAHFPLGLTSHGTLRK
jgi:hypothetical protein